MADRFFFLWLILSAGVHTAVIARVHLPGGHGDLHEYPADFLLRCVEAVEPAGPPDTEVGGAARGTGRDLPGAPGDGAGAGGAPACNVAVSGGGGPARRAQARRLVEPALMRGTGEVLRASVQETLRPLLADENPRGAAFAESVRRYKTRIEAIIERESRISYPPPAREDGREARLQIRFCLRSDGSLESVELPPSCGGFERELIAGLKKAARHFPAFPEGIGCDRLTFCWPVSFNLY